VARTGKKVKTTVILQLVIGLVLFGLGAWWSLVYKVGWTFGFTALFTLPLGVWMGLMLAKAVQSMIQDGAVHYSTRWQEIFGPRNIFLILYILAIGGVSLIATSFFYTFSSVEQAISFTKGQPAPELLMLAVGTAIILSLSSTIWVLVYAEWLRWCLKYEKEKGVSLYIQVEETQE